MFTNGKIMLLGNNLLPVLYCYQQFGSLNSRKMLSNRRKSRKYSLIKNLDGYEVRLKVLDVNRLVNYNREWDSKHTRNI